MLVKMAKLIQ